MQTVTMASRGPLTAALTLYRRQFCQLNAELGGGTYCWLSAGLDTRLPRCDFAEREDIKWEFRRQMTGAAGRLDKYKLPDNPRFDNKQEVYSLPLAVTNKLQVSPRLRYSCRMRCGWNAQRPNAAFLPTPSLRVVWRTPLLPSMTPARAIIHQRCGDSP